MTLKSDVSRERNYLGTIEIEVDKGVPLSERAKRVLQGEFKKLTYK